MPVRDKIFFLTGLPLFLFKHFLSIRIFAISKFSKTLKKKISTLVKNSHGL